MSIKSFMATGSSDVAKILLSRNFANLESDCWEIAVVSVTYQLPLFKVSLVLLSNIVMGEYGKLKYL
jgi:hypothetical protein